MEPGEPVDLAVGLAQAPVGGLGVGFGHGLLLVPVHGAVVSVAGGDGHQVVSDRGGERRGPPVLDGPFGYVGGPDLHGVAHRVGRDAGEVELGSPAGAVVDVVEDGHQVDVAVGAGVAAADRAEHHHLAGAGFGEGAARGFGVVDGGHRSVDHGSQTSLGGPGIDRRRGGAGLRR